MTDQIFRPDVDGPPLDGCDAAQTIAAAPAARRRRTRRQTPPAQSISFITTREGAPRSIVANVIAVFDADPQFADVLAYDEQRESVIKTRRPPWCDALTPDVDTIGTWNTTDSTQLATMLSRSHQLHIRPNDLGDAVLVVARRRLMNPLRDHLASLRWDGTVRLPTWLVKYAGADDTLYVRAVGTKMLIAGIARVFKPGCKVDTVPVLEAKQGLGKSTLLRTLAMRDEWFFDSDLAIGDKDAPQALRGKWIVELGELAALGKADVAKLKAFVSRQTDTYRASFGRRAFDYQRQWIGVGTTNDTEYLSDSTGNRRWQPVKLNRIDLPALKDVVPQLWAEARTRFEQGDPWHVDSVDLAEQCAAEADARRTRDPWESTIGDWIESSEGRAEIAAQRHMTTKLLLDKALKIPVDRQSRSEEMRAARVLQLLGFVKGNRARQGEKLVYPWVRHVPTMVSDPTSDQPPSETVGTSLETSKQGTSAECSDLFYPSSSHIEGEDPPATCPLKSERTEGTSERTDAVVENDKPVIDRTDRDETKRSAQIWPSRMPSSEWRPWGPRR